MELNELKETAIALMDALKARGLGEVELALDDVKIKIKAAPPVVTQAAAPLQPAAGSSASMHAAAEEEVEQGTPVRSPLVGTYYSAPAPDAAPFVLVGQKVAQGDTLFIIEAMKTMNEIKAPCSGTITRILAQPGDLVEYDQTVVIIA